jgi:hypothetical protein
MLSPAEAHGKGRSPEEAIFRGREAAVRHINLQGPHGLHSAQVDESRGHWGPGQGLQVRANSRAHREATTLLHVGPPGEVARKPLSEGHQPLDQVDCFLCIIRVDFGSDVVYISPGPNRP